VTFEASLNKFGATVLELLMMNHGTMLLEPAKDEFVKLQALNMLNPYELSFLGFDQLGVFFSLDFLLFFVYLPSLCPDNLEISVLLVVLLFNLPGFDQLLLMILRY
jgi:hypothetical protein